MQICVNNIDLNEGFILSPGEEWDIHGEWRLFRGTSERNQILSPKAASSYSQSFRNSALRQDMKRR